MDLAGAEDREHQAGKPRAAAEIHQDPSAPGRRGREERHQLGRIEHVAAPQVGEVGAADEVDGPGPAAQQRRVLLQPGQRFT